MPENLDRRDFLRRLTAASLILAGSGAGAAWLHNRPVDQQPAESSESPLGRRYAVQLPSGAPKLAIARVENLDAESPDAREAMVRRMIEAALEKMGGIGRFVVKGDVVVLKPNVGFDRPARLGVTTSPEAVGAMVALCRAAGAARVIVTDNPINNPEGSFLKSGVGEAARRNGGEVVLPEARHFRELNIGGKAVGRWQFFAGPFKSATKVIGMPTAKDHNLSGASLTMKNWYGLLGEGRNRFHQNIHEVIADLGAMLAPTLVVLDATRLLMRNGPTGGSLDDVKPGNAVVVGVDQVAIDAFGHEILGKDPGATDYLRLAEGRGLGVRDWKSLNPAECRL